MQIKVYTQDKSLENKVIEMVNQKESPQNTLRIKFKKDNKKRTFENDNQNFYRHVKK